MDYSHFTMEDFIQEIEKRPSLWNRSNTKYKNRLHSDRAWNDIASKVGISKETAKFKWRTLRDVFSRELKKIPRNSSGGFQNETYKGKWCHFSAMLFLKDTVKPRSLKKLAGNSSAKREDDSVCDADDAEDEDDSDGEDYMLDVRSDPIKTENLSPLPLETPTFTFPQLSETSDHTPSKTVLRKRAASKSNENLRKSRKSTPDNSYDDDWLRVTPDPVKASLSNTEESDTVSYFKSIIPYMENLTPLARLKVRSQIQNILIEAMETEAASTSSKDDNSLK